jgi:thiopeptide-type bacteriocin biosynthesis protein
VRFHGDPARLHASVLPAFEQAIAPLLKDGRLWRFQLDTYEREVERYGGPEGTVVAEKMFEADSHAVLELLARLDEGDAGGDERWQLALAGSAMLLDDLGLTLDEKRAMLESLRAEFAKEHRADAALRRGVGERFAKERARLEAIVDPPHDDADPLAPGFAVLRERSARLVPLVGELRALERAGRLSKSLLELAPSYLHMFVNRLVRSAARAHEMVLYDFLTRLYASRALRR